MTKKENRITLTDTTESNDVVLNFITYETPQITRNTLKIGTAEVVFQGAEVLTAEVLPITDRRLKTAWDHDLNRLRLKMTDKTFVMEIR